MNLLIVDLPSSLTEFKIEWFKGCSKIETLYLPNTITNLDNIFFNSFPRLQKINIPTSIQQYQQHWFDECTNLTKLSLPEEMEINETRRIADDHIHLSLLPSLTRKNLYGL